MTDLPRNDTPFGFGNKRWPGLAKVIEEGGELLQVCGKLLATGGAEEHWDGTNLRERITEEVADMLAAIGFLIARNNLDEQIITDRVARKTSRYQEWHAQGDNP